MLDVRGWRVGLEREERVHIGEREREREQLVGQGGVF
jgi:hypothetical protein